ncbi:MAG: LacI family DNA-binding transcriptional regulator [bacterium]
MSATIKDVAKKAFVSVATVSRVLNNNGYVHEETKNKINEVIKELNYKPNQFARFLSGKKTGTIGVLIPDLKNSFYSEFIDGLEKACHSNGYKLMLASTNDSKLLEQNYLETFKDYNVDGLIVASNILNHDILLNFCKPIVTVDHVLSNNIPSITCDNYQGGKLAALELNNHLCKNILLLRGPSFLITTIDRTSGFLETINPNSTVEIFDFDLINPNEDIIYKHLENNPQIDGIFATSDRLAIVAISALNKLNRKIPDECKIIGFDNTYFASYTNPPLTSIQQPINYIGMQSFNIFKKLVNQENIVDTHQVIEVSIIKRESTN